MENDGFGDWRIQAATRLAKDAPAVYAKGVVHKTGTPVYLTTMTKDASGKLVGFITPSPVALALNIATQAAAKASGLRKAIEFGDVMTHLGRGKNVAHESIPVLYDYFECCMITVTFSFQSLEAYCNQIISEKITGTYELKRENV